VGPAVTRNRLKRWLRIYFRGRLLEGKVYAVDLNVVFRKADENLYKRLDYDEFSEILDRGWQLLGQRFQRSVEQKIERPSGKHVEKDASSPRRSLPNDRNKPPRGRVPV
jgi:RNase P protein component